MTGKHRFCWTTALLWVGPLIAQEVPYTVATTTWPERLGSARVRIHVDAAAPAVWAHLPWRRHDARPETKAVLVLDADGATLKNAFVVRADAESGDVVFAPSSGPGDYYAYYLPLRDPPRENRSASDRLKSSYRAPQFDGDVAWRERTNDWRNLPRARTIEFQSRTEFDSFYPMEVIATRDELEALRAKHPRPYLLFVEDRGHPIRMLDALPAHWTTAGPKPHLQAQVYRGEFYVFQVGVYAQPDIATGMVPMEPKFEDLVGPADARISANAFTCFNTEGVDTHGSTFCREWTVPPGRVGVLWCGVQVPVEAAPGSYAGRLIVAPQHGAEMPVDIELEVRGEYLRNAGVDQPERLARLKWLNSTVGISDRVTAPYTPLRVKGTTVDCLGRQVQFGPHGFPLSVKAGGTELLAGPVTLQLTDVSGAITAFQGAIKTMSSTPGKVVFEADSSAEGYALHVRTTMEFDGGIGFEVDLTPGDDVDLADVTVEIPLRKDAVPYAAGMGMNGGNRPPCWEWNWSQQPQRWTDQGCNLEYFIWLGGSKQGLYCRLKSPLDDWRNGTQGGVRFEESGDRVVFRAFTGARRAVAGQPLHFSFRLLPTPLKPLDPQHWKYRYAHTYGPLDEIQATGATVVNVHHDTLPNLWINYPFLNLDLLIPYIREAHARGLKVKVYYTIRELTNHLPELWAFRSLGDEIYRVGGTQAHGASDLDWWLQEHVVSDYAPAWITRTPAGAVDAALRTRSVSRLSNFYLEGLQWLVENAEIDGLYLDEVAYPREIMQRLRRVLESRPGTMIDLHGNRQWWSCNSPIGYYLEHLPYVDRLWFGEEFNPDSPPDFWLVEMSGLPFGLSGDMLQNPNPWRGMVFGMTARAFYSGGSPTPLWKLWDEFGIQDAEMLGWWDEGCPVTTGRGDIVATVYRKRGEALVAVASWAPQAAKVKLAIDWNALGIDADRATLHAPELPGFQEQVTFPASGEIEVQPARGWLIHIK